jgi:hypothetical protein
MNMLSESEREALLRSLSGAPDEVLIDAVRQRKDWMKNIRSSFDEVRSFVGMKVMETIKPPLIVTATKADLTPSVEAAPKQRPNVNPGRSSISKIGTKTKDDLLRELGLHGILPGGKFEEHLKLLHNRGEVKYDGKEYYL